MRSTPAKTKGKLTAAHRCTTAFTVTMETCTSNVQCTMQVLDQGWATSDCQIFFFFFFFHQKIVVNTKCSQCQVSWLVSVLHSDTLQHDWLTRLVSVLHSDTQQCDWLTRFWVWLKPRWGLRWKQYKVYKFFVHLVRHVSLICLHCSQLHNLIYLLVIHPCSRQLTNKVLDTSSR